MVEQNYYLILQTLAPYFTPAAVKSIKNLVKNTDFMDDDSDKLDLPISLIGNFKRLKTLKITETDVLECVKWTSLHFNDIPEHLPTFTLSQCGLKMIPTRMTAEKTKESLGELVFQSAVYANGFSADVTEHEVLLYFAQFGTVKSIQKYKNPHFTDEESEINQDGYLIQYSSTEEIIKVILAKHVYEQDVISVGIVEIGAQSDVKTALKYSKNKVIQVFVTREINPSTLHQAFQKFTSVSTVQMPSAGYGYALVKLKTNCASNVCSLLQKEGGLVVQNATLNPVPLKGEQEMIFWAIEKNRPQIPDPDFIPLNQPAKSKKRKPEQTKEVASTVKTRKRVKMAQKEISGMIGDLSGFNF